jgi:hypothetical protein
MQSSATHLNPPLINWEEFPVTWVGNRNFQRKLFPLSAQNQRLHCSAAEKAQLGKTNDVDKKKCWEPSHF